MNYKEFYESLPVKDNNVKLLDGFVRGDNSHIINLTLIDGDSPFDFSGYSDIMLSIEGPDDILIKSIVTSNEEFNEENPYRIHVASAADGRLSFNLNGLATSKIGTYYARFIIFAGSDILTTARINYHVSKADKSIAITEYQNDSDYTGLVNLTSQFSSFSNAERGRVDAETWRKSNEESRQTAEAQRVETVNEMKALWENFKATLASVEGYAKSAAESAEIAKNPTVSAISSILKGMNLPSDMSEMGSLVDGYVQAYLNSGISGDDVLLTIKKFATAAAVTVLSAGELATETATGNVYLGTANGNVCLTQPYITADTAPTNKNLFWIDTSQTPSVLKYYNGSSWTAVQTVAVFG